MLWRWRFAELDDRDQVLKELRLALLLEFWFPFDEFPLTNRHGIWCDGIPLLVLTVINRTAIKMAGVGYFPYYYAPFELEFHFKHRRDRRPVRIVFRFGVAGDSGGIGTNYIARSPEKMFSKSPRHDRDWAIAVELTPENT